MATVRVPPPRTKAGATPKRGQAKAKSGTQEAQSWLFKYRHQLWPYWLMLVLALTTMIVENALVLGVGAVVLAALAYFFGQYARLIRLQERVYAALALLAAGGWSVWFTLQPGLRSGVALVLGGTLAAWPYFKHRSAKKTIPVTIAPDLRGQARQAAERKANEILTGWPVITRQGRIQFAELDGLRMTGHIMDVDVTLRGGQSARTVQQTATRNSLISAFDAPDDSMRTYTRTPKKPGQSSRSREVTLRFILHNLNAEPLGPPPANVDTMGRFETGEPVEYVDGVHTVIAGKSGHGKSVLMNQAIRRKIRKGWAVIGVDLKPGALEMGPWREVLAYLADKGPKLKLILEGLIREMQWRGDEMSAKGIRTWEPTREHPNIVLAVDEVQEVNQVPGAMALLIRLAQLSRAYGFELLLATQYPKDSNLPADIMAQVSQIFCCHLEKPTHDRVVFGENASTEGWTPSSIKAGTRGVYYVRSPLHREPSRALGWFMEVKEIEKEIPTMTRTVISRPWVPGFQAAGAATFRDAIATGDMESLAALEDAEDIVEADLVTEDPAEAIMGAIRAGAGVLDDITAATGLPRSSVAKILGTLETDGRITKAGSRATRSRPWTVVE